MCRYWYGTIQELLIRLNGETDANGLNRQINDGLGVPGTLGVLLFRSPGRSKKKASIVTFSAQPKLQSYTSAAISYVLASLLAILEL